MKTALLLFSLLLAAAVAARELDDKRGKSAKGGVDAAAYIPGFGADPGGFFGPGGGFNMPGFGGGWGAGYGGWGAGYGGFGGGYGRDGVAVPSVVCSDWGPCYNKKLTCPANCFTSYSRYGRGYGGGGGGGGCTIDCKKYCVAYC
ncbi:hypothetical protein B296_00024891 [Ensete ventricosum]|uniref:Uncharacterized protein n=1 Tax=Ensete ventricosum TaxID=4639 RepID=A0A426Z9G2_ENSVE|nr:hypothetical protein B296_00024891 [Ensete ventricosum]